MIKDKLIFENLFREQTVGASLQVSKRMFKYHLLVDGLKFE